MSLPTDTRSCEVYRGPSKRSLIHAYLVYGAWLLMRGAFRLRCWLDRDLLRSEMYR